PVDGMTCQAALRNGGDRAARLLPDESVTDAQGRFTLDPIPAGDLYIHCWGPRQCSNGYAPVTVAPGERATTDVPVVKRRGQAQLELGAVFDPTQILTAQVLRVVPGGPADAAGMRIGDRVLTVDGAAVDRLGMT